MSSAETTIPQIENCDPFGNFLHRKLRMAPLTFGIIVLTLDFIVDGYIGGHYHLFLKNPFPPPPPGILQDFMALVTDFIYLPLLCGLYLWAPLGTTQLFEKLLEVHIFSRAEDFTKVIDDKRKIYQSKAAFLFILTFALIMAVFQLGAYFDWFPWKTVGGYIDGLPEASYYRFPFWILLFYTLAYLAFNVGVTIYTLRTAFRSAEIEIFPLHPDKCGGLGAISKYTTVIAFGIGTIGLVLSAATIYEIVYGELARAYPVLLGIGAYLILAPLFFFLPLGTAHETMRKAKDEELLGISQKYAQTYKGLDITTRSLEEYDKEFANLERIKKLYEVADSFPVWPFDTRSLRRFMIIVTAPVLPAIISFIESYISQVIQ
jgi:hypothetical protein